MVITLYKHEFSPPVRAVMMTIDTLKIPDVEYVHVQLLKYEHLTEEYLKLNPLHTIPMLKDDDFVIHDSHAINAYLVGKYGKDDSLYPRDLKKRALVDQRLHFDNGILFPAIRNVSAALFLKGEKTVRPELFEKMVEAYDFTEKFLASSTWIAGDQLTIADFSCVATITSIDTVLKIDENKYPNITAWVKRCSELETFQKINVPGIKMLVEIYRSRLQG